MIKSLRLKFIRITMAAVFSVLFLIVLTINVFNICQNNQSLDYVTGMLLENGGIFRKPPPDTDKGRDENKIWPGGFKEQFHNRKELPFSTRFFTVSVDRDGKILRYDLSSIASVSEDELADYTKRILAKESRVGWLETYRYRVGETAEGSMLIVLEATGTRHAILSVLLITSLVALAAFAAVFFLVALFSRKAIKPISETYEKQKQFITDASHELKTPLTVIAANTEILSLTYGRNEWCDGIERQTDGMRELIGQMIQMARLDESKEKLPAELFSFSDAVYDTALAFSVPAKKRGLLTDLQIDPDLCKKGNEGAIRQLIAILTDNAVKYCDAGGTVSVSVKSVKEFGKEHILLSVKNTYARVEELDTKKIFERFYRGDPARSSAHSYGLGLSIAWAIAKQHGAVLQAVKGDGFLEMRLRW